MRLTPKGGVLAAVGLLCGIAATSATAERYHGFQGEDPGYVPHMDARSARLEPTAAQLQAAQALNAVVRWGQFGTPRVINRIGDFLTGPNAGSPEQVARDYLRSHAALFGMSASQIDSLRLLRLSPLHESPEYRKMLQGETVSTDNVPHVVLLQQFADNVPLGDRDGLVTVGVSRTGRIAFVGSTLARMNQLSGLQRLSEIDALLASAANVQMNLGALELIPSPLNDFSTYASNIIGDVQRVRLRAVPTADQGLRLAYEVTLLDSSHDRGHPQAFISMIDAETGKVWVRNNAVQHLADTQATPRRSAPIAGPLQGTTADGACSAPHAFAVSSGNDTISIIASASSIEQPGSTAPAEPADITIELYRQGIRIASQDLLGSPEAMLFQPAGGIPEDNYEVVICPFTAGAAPISYNGVFTAAPGIGNPLVSPAWSVFTNTPIPLRAGPAGSQVGDDIREFWCWDVADEDPRDDGDLGRDPALCEGPELRNVSSRVPWDALADGTPTFTTHGNNASTAVSNVSFVSPDTVFLRPIAINRTYDFEFTNAWENTQCNPLTFLNPAQNLGDFEAATANLFAMHNRMHDWSYLLGFTEVNSNLQFDNFGLTSVARENDGELGQSQAGRLTVNGRDNANQLTLQDGVPGITNQYLWQALPATIYPPSCVDGAFDMAIVAHEYTHAISNRMTAGPDGSLGGGQSGSMGESWSDLAAIEYLQGYGYSPLGTESAFALAVYTTGDPEAGIRNFGFDVSPLNFSNFGYDGNGATSPHADGEIWSATNFHVRQALVDKYQSEFPYEDLRRQTDCADGLVSSEACPGNRRWIQLLFDGFLIQPAGPSMLDARDAILAADLLRYDGANQFELWEAFAGRGMGAEAFSADNSDGQPRPDFSSPLRSDNARITFAPQGVDGVTPIATVYTGTFEARVSPTADTDPDTPRTSDFMRFVPGTYQFVVQANGYGLQRFTETFAAGEERTLAFPLRVNLASTHRGAVASGDGDSPQEFIELIDDTETTNWQSTDGTGTASEGKGEGAFVEGRQVTIALAERARVTDVQVSAALTPEGQNRYTALRSFDLFACDAAAASCDGDGGYSLIYSSPDDAFNGRWLRPKAPHLQLRTFDVEDSDATHIRLVVRDSQCTGGPDFQGDVNPSGDPLNDPDCDTGSNLQLQLVSMSLTSNIPNEVRIAEIQVFSDAAASTPSRDTPVVSASSRGGAAGWMLLLIGLLGLGGLRRR